MAESKEELKWLLKVKEESEKAGLQLSIQTAKIVASGPITSWQIEGGNVEAVMDFLFLGSETTVARDCNHEIKRHLLLVRKGLNGKAPDAGKDGSWEEKGTTEDEMAGWHHRLNGHEFD